MNDEQFGTMMSCLVAIGVAIVMATMILLIILDNVYAIRVAIVGDK